jgi:NADH-ubiquinone oxidoreductase chain 6
LFFLIFLVVYVGAIAVLFLFVVMMLNIKVTEMNEKKLRYLPLGVLIGFLFLFQILYIIEKETIPALSHQSISFLSWWEDVESTSNIQSIGNSLYTHNGFHFILASIILFIAMIGAIVLTMHKNVFIKRQEVLTQNYREFTKTIRRVHLPTER